MIDPDKRNAVYQLHCEGVSLRKISRLLHISYNTVSRIVQQQGKMPETQRKDRIQKIRDPQSIRTHDPPADAFPREVGIG